MGELVEDNRDSIQHRIEGEQQPVIGEYQIREELDPRTKTAGTPPVSIVPTGDSTGNLTVKTQKRAPQKAKAVAKTSVGDTIEKLQEKILLLQYVESVKVPDVPSGNTKEARELLLQVGRDIELVKIKAMEKISKL